MSIAIGQMLVGPACGEMLDLRHHDYRYIYLWWCGFALLSLLATLVVHRKFIGYGGPKRYAAPEWSAQNRFS